MFLHKNSFDAASIHFLSNMAAGTCVSIDIPSEMFEEKERESVCMRESKEGRGYGWEWELNGVMCC